MTPHDIRSGWGRHLTTLDRLKAFPGFIAYASGVIPRGHHPRGHQASEVWESQEARVAA